MTDCGDSTILVATENASLHCNIAILTDDPLKQTLFAQALEYVSYLALRNVFDLTAVTTEVIGQVFCRK